MWREKHFEEREQGLPAWQCRVEEKIFLRVQHPSKEGVQVQAVKRKRPDGTHVNFD